METSIQPDPSRFNFESQIRDCYGRVSYSHKTHEKMAEGHAKTLNCIKWAQIVLSALITGGAVGVLFDKGASVYPIVTAVLAIAALIVNSYMKDVDPGTAAQKHREAASKLWNTRELYLSLIVDVRDPDIPLDDLRKRRDKIQDDLVKIYASAPHTNGSAYIEAQGALQDKEDLTFSDEELDKLLPPSLQRTSGRRE